MEKIVCLGDSITFGYQIGTKKQVENPYPKVLSKLLNVEVINSGHSGYRSINCLNGLDKYVFQHSPDMCIVMLGINDARGSHMGVTLSSKTYISNMKKIIKKLQDKNIEVLVLVPTPTNNKRVRKFSLDLMVELNQLDINYIDMFVKTNCALRSNNLEFEEVFLDGVHLDDDYYKWISHIVADRVGQNA